MQILEMVQSDNSELKSLVAAMPTELSESELEQQIQVALACFSAGVSSLRAPWPDFAAEVGAAVSECHCGSPLCRAESFLK